LRWQYRKKPHVLPGYNAGAFAGSSLALKPAGQRNTADHACGSLPKRRSAALAASSRQVSKTEQLLKFEFQDFSPTELLDTDGSETYQSVVVAFPA
jgi:hypothetical protein